MDCKHYGKNNNNPVQFHCCRLGTFYRTNEVKFLLHEAKKEKGDSNSIRCFISYTYI